MADFTKHVGNAAILDSGVVIFADDEERFTINIRGLRFSITSCHDQSKPTITTEMLEQNHILIKINIRHSSGLIFRFRVGTLLGCDLSLAVNLEAHRDYSIVTYTFSQQASLPTEKATAFILAPDTDGIKVDDQEIATLNQLIQSE